MPEGSRTPRDRRLLLAIGICTLIGSITLGIGIWGLVKPPPDWMPVQGAIAPVGEVMAGLTFLGVAVFESARRIRQGPQQPGRHASSNDPC